MAGVEDVAAKISQLTEIANQSLKYDTEVLYQQFQAAIYDLEGLAREAFQVKLSDLYWSILAKLEKEKQHGESPPQLAATVNPFPHCCSLIREMPLRNPLETWFNPSIAALDCRRDSTVCCAASLSCVRA